MDSLQFIKMHGCGNDFLFIDGFKDKNVPAFSEAAVQAICDRNFGMGADGLAVISPGEDTDAQWTFYNCDGSRAEMCGNAARCAIRFLSDNYFKDAEIISLKTVAAVIKGRVLENGLVEVALVPAGKLNEDYEEKYIKFDDEAILTYNLNTGVPHAVIEVDDIKSYPINRVGKLLVGHSAFGTAGSNVTFFQKRISRQIYSTTFERGVEEETLACGTGVGAAALVYAQLHYQDFPITVEVPGGVLEVDKSESSSALLLRGPAEYVMQAELLMNTKTYEPRKRFGKH